jgi:hypothetical protein
VIADRAAGTTRTLRGFRVTSVEPHAPRIWIVPDTRRVQVDPSRDLAEPRLIDIAGDGIDSPPAELYALRLGVDGEPRADVDARWTEWQGPGGYSVSVEIDVNKGACPGAMRISKTGSSLNAWSAKVPTDVVTFEPVGWSPSGAYFAVITQADKAETDRIVSDWVTWFIGDRLTGSSAESTREATPGFARFPTREADVVVFSVVDGAVAAKWRITAPVLEPNAGSSLVAWSAKVDRLYFLDSASGAPMLRAGLPGTPGTGTVSPGAPWEHARSERVWIAGADGEDVIVASGSSGNTSTGMTALLRAGEGAEARALGSARGEITARWSPIAGLLTLEGFRQDMAWTAFRSEIDGRAPKRLLAVDGPTSAVPAD